MLRCRNNGGLLQFTQGGSKVKHQCQSIVVGGGGGGGAGFVWGHTAKKLRMAWFEKGNIIYRDFKKALGGFLSLKGGYV